MHSSSSHYPMMKYTITTLLSLILIITIGGATGEDSSHAPVVDSDGDKVVAGEEYTILAFMEIGVATGWLALASPPGGGPCPLNVVLSISEEDEVTALPLFFYPLNENETVIRASTDTNMMFNTSTDCPETTVWRVLRDNSLEKLVVTTNGELEEYSSLLLPEHNRFKLEEVEVGLYKLKYCPSTSICPACEPICEYLRLEGDDYEYPKSHNRLVVSSSEDDSAFQLVIQKPTRPNKSRSIIRKPHTTS